MLCDGDWLVELDHDDCLTSNALEVSNNAILKFPDAGFLYSDCCEYYETGEYKYYDHDWTGNWYGRPDNFFDFGYAGHEWEIKMWERGLYHKIGGHNKGTPVADDLEMSIKTFLNTRMIHVKKVLYLQYSSRNTTTDNNSIDINRRARLIRDFYDKQIHDRIHELGFVDWNWDDEKGHSQKFQNAISIRKLHDEEQKMNYIYE
jgi:hypothetical protein